MGKESEENWPSAFGSVYNHSYQPNARYEPDFDLNIMEFIAIRDIVAGEEITTNYNYDPEDDSPVWWEKSRGRRRNSILNALWLTWLDKVLAAFVIC